MACIKKEGGKEAGRLEMGARRAEEKRKREKGKEKKEKEKGKRKRRKKEREGKEKKEEKKRKRKRRKRKRKRRKEKREGRKEKGREGRKKERKKEKKRKETILRPPRGGTLSPKGRAAARAPQGRRVLRLRLRDLTRTRQRLPQGQGARAHPKNTFFRFLFFSGSAWPGRAANDMAELMTSQLCEF